MSTSTEQSEQSATALARETGERVAQRAKAATAVGGDRVRTEVDRRTTMAGERMRSAGSDLRELGEELRAQGKEGPASVATAIAERLQGPADYLVDADADRILGDAEDFGRRRPWAVMAVGVAVGIAAARVLRASSARRHAGSGSQWTGAAASGEGATGSDRLGAGQGAGR